MAAVVQLFCTHAKQTDKPSNISKSLPARVSVKAQAEQSPVLQQGCGPVVSSNTREAQIPAAEASVSPQEAALTAKAEKQKVQPSSNASALCMLITVLSPGTLHSS